MFKKLIHKIVGNPTQKFLDSLLPTVEEVNELEARFQPMTDDELRNYSQQLRERHGNGESLDELLPTSRAYGKGHDSLLGLVGGMLVMALSLLLMR